MMRYALILALAGASLAGMATPVGAHHSFSAFDRTTRVTWEGVITQVQWKSPHSWIFVDVTDASGVTVNWGFESVSAAMFAQRVKPSLLKKGVRISITGAPGRIPSEQIGLFEEFTLDGATYYVQSRGRGAS